MKKLVLPIVCCLFLLGCASRQLDTIGGKYARDEDHVYFSSRLLEDVNSERFSVIKCDGKGGNSYAMDFGKDDKFVYYMGEVIEGADPGTFGYLDGKCSSYSTDSSYVYFGGKVIEGADVKSFKELKDGYSTDKSNVYWLNKKLEGADPITFESRGMAYHCASTVYAIDANHVFADEKVVEGMSPDNFDTKKIPCTACCAPNF